MSAREEIIHESVRNNMDARDEGDSEFTGAARALDLAMSAASNGESGEIVVSFKPHKESVVDYDSADDAAFIPDSPGSKDLYTGRDTPLRKIDEAIVSLGGSIVEVLGAGKNAGAAGLEKGKAIISNRRAAIGAGLGVAAVVSTTVAPVPAIAGEVNEKVVEFDESGSVIQEVSGVDDKDKPEIIVSFGNDKDRSVVSTNQGHSDRDEAESQAPESEEVPQVEVTDSGDTSVKDMEVSFVVTNNSSEAKSSDNDKPAIKVHFDNSSSAEEAPVEENIEVEGLQEVQAETIPEPTIDVIVEPAAEAASEQVVEGPAVDTPTETKANIDQSKFEPGKTPVVSEGTTIAETVTPQTVSEVETRIESEATLTITVKKGQTLSELAEDHDTTVSELVRLNSGKYPGLIDNPHLIHVGDELVVSEAGEVVVIVEENQTLSEIAEGTNYTAEELAELNGIENPNIILINQKIKIPRLAKEIEVQEGQTVNEIAEIYGVTPDELSKANDLVNRDFILNGQTLIIPIAQSEELEEATAPEIVVELEEKIVPEVVLESEAMPEVPEEVVPESIPGPETTPEALNNDDTKLSDNPDLLSELSTPEEVIDKYGGSLSSSEFDLLQDDGLSLEQIARVEVMLSSDTETPIPPNMVLSANSDGKHVVPLSYNNAYEFWGNTPVSQRGGAFSTVKAIVFAAEQWNLIYPDNPVLVGDLDATGHQTHNKGGVDTDWFIKDMLTQYTESGEQGTAAQMFIMSTILIKAGADRLLLNNNEVASLINDWADRNNYSARMVTTVPGHSGHIHVDWQPDWMAGVTWTPYLAGDTQTTTSSNTDSQRTYDQVLNSFIDNADKMKSVYDGSLAGEIEVAAAAEVKAEEERRLAEEKKAAEEKAKIESKESKERAAAEATKAEEERRAAEIEATEESVKPPGITTEQLIVAEADTVEKLIALGYTSLAKIPKADQKALDKVLAQMPTIEEAVDKYNARQGDPRGPTVPATAVLAIAYDLGMRGDDLIDSVTTSRGESIGFHPYIIGDDKGERTSDNRLTRIAVGLVQIFQSNKNGLTDAQMRRAEVLLHPVAAMIEMVDYKNTGGLAPWYFSENEEEHPDIWNAHKDKVLDAAEELEDSGFDIIP